MANQGRYQNRRGENEGKKFEAWLPEAGMILRQKMKQDSKYTCRVGYSDFHNLMGFSSKKMLNNILKNVY